MTFAHIPCVPFGRRIYNRTLVAIVHKPSVFCGDHPRVLTYNFNSYKELECSEYLGVAGKWISPHIFVPPLALFPDRSDAVGVLTLELCGALK